MDEPKTPAGTLGEEAALAAEDPPRSFSAFALTPLRPPPGPDVVPWINFAVACKACGGDQFHLGSHPMTAPDPSPYAEVAPGEAMPGPPHRLKCAACGDVRMLFDPRTDGYDGVLGQARAAGEGSAEVFTPAAFRMWVMATYNIELWELRELAAQAGDGVKPTDLFDWINIIGRRADDGERFELDYECA